MLESFADGVSTEDALQEAIGLDADEFDIAFRESMQVQYGELTEISYDVIPNELPVATVMKC